MEDAVAVGELLERAVGPVADAAGVGLGAAGDLRGLAPGQIVGGRDLAAGIGERALVRLPWTSQLVPGCYKPLKATLSQESNWIRSIHPLKQ